MGDVLWERNQISKCPTRAQGELKYTHTLNSFGRDMQVHHKCFPSPKGLDDLIIGRKL